MQLYLYWELHYLILIKNKIRVPLLQDYGFSPKYPRSLLQYSMHGGYNAKSENHKATDCSHNIFQPMILPDSSSDHVGSVVVHFKSRAEANHAFIPFSELGSTSLSRDEVQREPCGGISYPNSLRPRAWGGEGGF